MTLREKQSLFAKLLAELITWISANGWEVTLGEGHVADTDAADGDYDGPHLRQGGHYKRLAMDLNLFVAGEFKSADCPEWQAIGAHWKSLHPLCRWGGDFAKRDYNHFSLEDAGVA
jgi:hypothetical protein